MANNRTAIRTAVKTLLNGATSAGANVYANRDTNLWQSELPSILIYTASEPATPENFSQSRYVRNLELQIKVKVEGTSDVDDDLDSLVGEVEDIIFGDLSLGGTVLSTILTNTEMNIDSEAEKDIGVAVLTFECKYIS